MFRLVPKYGSFFGSLPNLANKYRIQFSFPSSISNLGRGRVTSNLGKIYIYILRYSGNSNGFFVLQQKSIFPTSTGLYKVKTGCQ